MSTRRKNLKERELDLSDEEIERVFDIETSNLFRESKTLSDVLDDKIDDPIEEIHRHFEFYLEKAYDQVKERDSYYLIIKVETVGESDESVELTQVWVGYSLSQSFDSLPLSEETRQNILCHFA